MLAFRVLLESTENSANRRFLLAGKVEDMLNTVVRQIAFHNFETAFHDAPFRRGIGRAAKRYLDGYQSAALTLRCGWRIAIALSGPIFPILHSPFYVYAYAFGDCLVNALWQSYQNRSDDARLQFVTDYRGLLAAGGIAL